MLVEELLRPVFAKHHLECMNDLLHDLLTMYHKAEQQSFG